MVIDCRHAPQVMDAFVNLVQTERSVSISTPVFMPITIENLNCASEWPCFRWEYYFILIARDVMSVQQ